MQPSPNTSPPPAPKRPSIGMRRPVTRPPPNGPSSKRDGRDLGPAVAARGEGDRGQRDARAARGIRRDRRRAAHRPAAARLAQVRSARSAVRRRCVCDVAVDAQPRLRPVIGHAVAAATRRSRAPLGRARIGALSSRTPPPPRRLTIRSEPSTSKLPAAPRIARDQRARRSARAACPWPRPSGPVSPAVSDGASSTLEAP